MKKTGIFFGILFVLSLLPIYLVLAFQIPAYTKSFYAFEFEQNKVYEAVLMEKEDLWILRDKLIDYMKGKTDTLQIDVKIDGKIQPFFSTREILHMEDVRGLFDLARVVKAVAVTIAFLSLIIYFYLQKEYKTLGKIMKITAMITAFLLAILGIYGYRNFDALFTKFHLLSFSNDLWLLDPKVDRLINIVPTAFFEDAVFIMVCFILFVLGVQFLLGRILQKKVTSSR